LQARIFSESVPAEVEKHDSLFGSVQGKGCL